MSLAEPPDTNVRLRHRTPQWSRWTERLANKRCPGTSAALQRVRQSVNKTKGRTGPIPPPHWAPRTTSPGAPTRVGLVFERHRGVPRPPRRWALWQRRTEASRPALRVARSLASAKKNGATVIAEPVDAEGFGRFGILRDPLGGMIGMIEPASPQYCPSVCCALRPPPCYKPPAIQEFP